MKKYCLAAALSMAFLAPVAKADMLLGLYVGADGWQSENSGSFAGKGQAESFNKLLRGVRTPSAVNSKY